MTRWALVTGASSGIGRELARLAAADGHAVLAVARGAAALESLCEELEARHGRPCLAHPADLATAEGLATLLAATDRRGIVPDLLVNAAGFGAWGRHAELAGDAQDQMLALNVVAPTRLTRALLPAMLARGSGRILNVASTGAFQPGPYMAVYYASKAYLLHYSEALAEELAGSGVSVTALCPGPTASGFQARAAALGGHLIVRRLPPLAAAAAVARAGYQGARAGRRVVVPGLSNRLLAGSVRLLPRRLVTALLARLSHPA